MKTLLLLTALLICCSKEDEQPVYNQPDIVIADHIWLNEHKDTLLSKIEPAYLTEYGVLFYRYYNPKAHMMFVYVDQDSVIAFQYYGTPILKDPIFDAANESAMIEMYEYGQECGIGWKQFLPVPVQVNDCQILANYDTLNQNYKLIYCEYYQLDELYRIMLIQATRTDIFMD